MTRERELVVTDLHKSFTHGSDRVPVLAALDFRVSPTEFVSLLGPSGSGKSTVLRIVAGLIPADRGEVRLGDAVLRGPDPGCCLVFQDPRLLPWLDVSDNVGFGLPRRHPDTRTRVQQKLAAVGLEGFEHAYPYQLSGGMAQRAALARALVSNPRLLLLDEPFSALDPSSRIRMQEELGRLQAQTNLTTVLVTHDVEEAIALSDRVLILSSRPARIVADVPIALPTPRRRSTRQFLDLQAQILGILANA